MDWTAPLHGLKGFLKGRLGLKCETGQGGILMIFGLVLAALLSLATVVLVQRKADRLGLVQGVNHRSSHVRPTPTGGGMGIALGTIVGGSLVVTADTGLLLVLVLGLVVALLGLYDDRLPLPARLRLLVQTVLMALLVISTGAPGMLLGEAGWIWLGLLGVGLTLAGVWWLNLFNFLDGIDGYAGSEALFMLLAGLVLAFANDTLVLTAPLAGLSLVAGAATLGFLLFNWPPAKIFMGDVGSTFLGFLLFALALLGIAAGWQSLWQWAILGVLFAADASVTLLRRLLRGENVLEAHKSHAYQRLARDWQGHRPVTLALIALNLFLVLPLAWAAGYWPELGWGIAVLTYGAACAGAWLLGAGRADG